MLNGVKQGGILSPVFCNISGVGCIIISTFINHLIYADAMCILAPSMNAVEYLKHLY